MYTITLEINQICNFRCTYCYLGNLSGEEMSLETAYQAMDIAFVNAQKHPDHKLWVDFVGGETLISFEFMKDLCKWIDIESEKKNLEVHYSITTNGSIMSSEILKWLIENRIRIKLSVDGKKEVHDKNRKDKSKRGTYDLVLKNIPEFHEYEMKSKIPIQVSHVITGNNYQNLYESIFHIVEDLKMWIVDSSLDLSFSWENDQLDYIAKEWEKILEYYVLKMDKGSPFLWGMLLDLVGYSSVCKECGVGLVRIYVRTDGSIYGCSANLKNEGYIGDVRKGVYIKKIRSMQTRECVTCEACSLKKHCMARLCIMSRRNNIYGEKIPNSIMCYLEEKKQILWEKYKEKIKLLVR